MDFKFEKSSIRTFAQFDQLYRDLKGLKTAGYRIDVLTPSTILADVSRETLAELNLFEFQRIEAYEYTSNNSCKTQIGVDIVPGTWFKSSHDGNIYDCQGIDKDRQMALILPLYTIFIKLADLPQYYSNDQGKTWQRITT